MFLFEWIGAVFIEDVLAKLDEEMDEFKEAVRSDKKANLESEFGDLLFALVNIARHQMIDAEEALRSTNGKFVHRFQHIERRVAETGKELNATSLKEMEQYWQEAKQPSEDSP